jgi:hypothetical protein
VEAKATRLPLARRKRASWKDILAAVKVIVTAAPERREDATTNIEHEHQGEIITLPTRMETTPHSVISRIVVLSLMTIQHK